MSRSDYLARSREAGQYIQTYMRERQDDFVEAARNSHRNQGWHGTGVDEAHEAAMFLLHYTDEHFLNCRIPEDYGSPLALASALSDLRQYLSHSKKALEGIITDAKDKAARTVPMVFALVGDTLYATEETLEQIADAAKELPSNDLSSFLAVAPSPMERVQEIANQFHEVLARMKTRRKDREPLTISDEYDVQYLFEGLLSIPFRDVRPEEPTLSVAGGAGRADTLLKAERIFVEYKCTRKGLSDKELRKQIADDFLLYGKHPDCDQLFVFVYDRDQHIKNPAGFEADLTVSVDGISEVRIAIRR